MLDSFLLRGTASPPPEPIELRAGPLTLLFEPGNGMIRRICYGDIEIWRGLYAAVRDQNWGTVPPRLFNLETNIKDDAFDISFDVECKQNDIDFFWQGTLRGTNEGQIEYSFHGKARSNFRRNRIGFCLLHPPQCAGAECELKHANGSRETRQFPKHIAPHQPFLNLHSISHEFASGQWAQALLHGDVFETEDQRNWTDASFKTYCTPLDLPFPVTVEEGDIVEQKVFLKLKLPALPIPAQCNPANQNEVIVITSDKQGNFAIGLPPIGLCMASHGEALTKTEAWQLNSLNMSHLRADLKFNEDWQATFQQAAHEARALETKLELALHLPPQPQEVLREVARALEQNDVSIARFLILNEDEKVTTEVTARAAREVFGSHGSPIIGGTDFYFTEINRQHPPIDLLDGVCFSITPQVHAFDDLSLMENLEMQATVVENARRLFGLPIHVSPVTFKKRGNPDATGAESQTAPDELPPDVDPRQMSLFGAAWTLDSLKTLSEAGAASITYYETTGMKGVMQRENAAPHPQFPAPSGAFFPIYQLFNWLWPETRFMFTLPRQPLNNVVEIVLEDGGFYCRLFANLTSQSVNFTVRGVQRNAYWKQMDLSNAYQGFSIFSESPEQLPYIHLPVGDFDVTLPPYAIATLTDEY